MKNTFIAVAVLLSVACLTLIRYLHWPKKQYSITVTYINGDKEQFIISSFAAPELLPNGSVQVSSITEEKCIATHVRKMETFQSKH